MAVKHTYRWGKGTKIGTRTESLTPLKAITRFCRECYGFDANSAELIRDCASYTCALWPFRQGKGHKKGGSE